MNANVVLSNFGWLYSKKQIKFVQKQNVAQILQKLKNQNRQWYIEHKENENEIDQKNEKKLKTYNNETKK